MVASYAGYVGVVAFALAWIPQTVETVRRGRCEANPMFLLLSAVGSAALMAYALARRDAVFSALNAMTCLGALINAYFRAFPSAAGRRQTYFL